jgi:hypothetical protein
LGRAFIGRKVKIIVAEPVHGLIVLRHAWGIEDAGVLFCDYNLVFKIDFHGGFELEEEVIPASCRAVNGVIVLIGTVVFAEIQSVHGGAPCVSGLSPERVISVIIRRFLMKADYPDGSLSIKFTTSPEEKSNTTEKRRWNTGAERFMIESSNVKQRR